MKILAMSDLHGHLPKSIPECDLLLIGGDVCSDGFKGRFARHFPEVQKQWFLESFLEWARKAPANHVFVTWGNHDFCGTLFDYRDGVFKLTDKVTLVVDQVVEFEGVKIWLSPWSNKFMDWAFMKDEAGLMEVYNRIPEGTDIVVSHGPPFGFGDVAGSEFTGQPIHVGSKALFEALLRVRPKFTIFGHIHGGYGTYHFEDMNLLNTSVVNEKYELVNEPVEIEV